MTTRKHRVWIELEVTLPNVKGPSAAECKALNEEHAALATNMLKRLGASSEIFWNEHKTCYCVADSSGTYLQMGDKGHWFNLDYFGRGE